MNQVQFAVVEPNGKLSLLLKPEFMPVTPQDLNLPTQAQGLTTELIYDGVVIEENLKKAGVNRQFLDKEMKKKGIKKTSEIFLATIDHAGNLYFDKYQDKVKNN